MIAGTDFSEWLADREAQTRSQDGVQDCARRWSGHPLMNELAREIALPDRTPQSVLAAARRFIDRSQDIDALMDELIASSRSDPYFRPPLHPISSDIHTGLLLFHEPELSVALGVTGVDMLAAKKSGKRPATSIGFSGVLTLFRYVKAGGATISFWEAPPITGDFHSGDAGRCRLTGRRRIEDGEEILIDGARESGVIEHATSDMLYFQAIVRTGAAPLVIEYDSANLGFVGASSTDEAASRVQMMVTMLRTMGRDDALPLIREALNSPHFYTRWHIMRELLAMDADAAYPELRRMAQSDPHPEVRAAAQQTLRLFVDDEPAAAAQGRAA